MRRARQEEPHDELARSVRSREAGARRLGDVLSGCLDALDARGAGSRSMSIGRAWHAANGDVERAHTTGLFVREPRGHETLPTLVVYVDSRARATDFTANREVYLARLANVGLRFADVVFRENRIPGRAPASPQRPRPSSPAPVPPPELTAAERRRVDELVLTLPEHLRAPVARAMSASLRSEKSRSDTK